MKKTIQMQSHPQQGESVKMMPFALTALAAAMLTAAPVSQAADECGPGPVVTCTGAKPQGVTYVSAVPFSLSATGNINAGANGFEITTSGSAGMTFSTTGNITGTGGVDLFATGSGSINASVAQVAGGLRATTGTGSIQILETTGTGNVTSNIRAVSTSGDVALSFAGQQGAFNSRRATVHLETGGDGDIQVNNSSLNSPNGQNRGLGMNLTTISDAGTTNIELGGTHASILSLNAMIGSGGLVLNYGSDHASPSGNINSRSGAPEGTAAVRNLSVVGSGDVFITLLDNSDETNSPGEIGSTTRALDAHRLLAGVHDFSGVTGKVNIALEANTYWRVDPGQLSHLSSGDDEVTIGAGAAFYTAQLGGGTPAFLDLILPGDPPITAAAVVDFGTGLNVLNNRGDIYVGPNWALAGVDSGGLIPTADGGLEVDISFIPAHIRSGYQAELRLENLDTFNNSGTIWLGASFIGASSSFIRDGLGPEAYVSGPYRDAVFGGTDRVTDDILALPGAHFMGLEGSRIVMDANFNRIGQTRCGVGARDEGGRLANDCVDLSGAGAAASGRTAIEIVDVARGERGAYNPDGNVLVDLTGGDAAAIDPEAFYIAPESSSYNPNVGNGVIDKGLFIYSLGYDEDRQQFRLYGLPGAATQQFPLAATAANSLWTTATAGWFEHRSDGRVANLPAGFGGGVWFRAADDRAERDLLTMVEAGSEVFDFDNSYQQDNTTLTFGLDFIDRFQGDARWTVGAMVGYARGRLDYNLSENQVLLSGMHAGLYSSLTHGAFYLDAAFNQTWLDLDNDAPRLQLEPAGTELASEVKSQGLRLEAGWKFELSLFGIEPLLGYSQVTSEIDDIVVPTGDQLVAGGVVSFEKATSQRASAGLRVSINDLLTNIAPTSLTVTARTINETDGQARASVDNSGLQDVPTNDTLDGTFTQLTGTVRINNATETISGYLNVDTLTGDDYDSLGFSAGFRYQW